MLNPKNCFGLVTFGAWAAGAVASAARAVSAIATARYLRARMGPPGRKTPYHTSGSGVLGMRALLVRRSEIQDGGDLGFGDLVIYTITQATKPPNHQLESSRRAWLSTGAHLPDDPSRGWRAGLGHDAGQRGAVL